MDNEVLLKACKRANQEKQNPPGRLDLLVREGESAYLYQSTIYRGESEAIIFYLYIRNSGNKPFYVIKNEISLLIFLTAIYPIVNQ